MADNIYQELDEILTNLIQELNNLQEEVDNGNIEDPEGAHIAITQGFSLNLNNLDGDSVSLLDQQQREQLMNKAYTIPNIDLPDGGIYEGFHLAQDLNNFLDENPFVPPEEAQEAAPNNQNQQEQIIEIAPAAGGSKKRKSRTSRKSKKSKKTRKNRKSLRRRKH